MSSASKIPIDIKRENVYCIHKSNSFKSNYNSNNKDDFDLKKKSFTSQPKQNTFSSYETGRNISNNNNNRQFTSSTPTPIYNNNNKAVPIGILKQNSLANKQPNSYQVRNLSPIKPSFVK
jgi:hypothetical protein